MKLLNEVKLLRDFNGIKKGSIGLVISKENDIVFVSFLKKVGKNIYGNAVRVPLKMLKLVRNEKDKNRN